MTYAISLEGRNALVTGASSGLGRHFAESLARAGAAVAVAARRRNSLEQVRSEITSAGGKAVVVAMDVTSPSSIAASIDYATTQLGSLDILVNNAGVTLTKPVLEIEEREWDQLVDTNLKGAFLVAQSAARVMKGQPNGGSVVNIASILGLRVAGLLAASGAAKAARACLTRATRPDLARYSACVTAPWKRYPEVALMSIAP